MTQSLIVVVYAGTSRPQINMLLNKINIFEHEQTNLKDVNW